MDKLIKNTISIFICLTLGIVIFILLFKPAASRLYCQRKIGVVVSELKKSVGKGGREFNDMENIQLSNAASQEYKKCLVSEGMK